MTERSLPPGWDVTDLDILAGALRNQDADVMDLVTVIDRATGQLHLWTSDTGLAGDGP